MRVVVEGDSLTVIKKLRCPVEDRSVISGIIKEIKIRCRSFESVKYSFVPRQGNQAAEGQNFEGTRVWVEEVLEGADLVVE